MEGRDLESICRTAVKRIDECLAEAEVVKSIQNSQIGRHEPMNQGLMFKPVNLYGSRWLQRQPVAEPDLPRTLDSAHSSNAKKYGLPGPLSQDNDEDSSPFVQDWDLADHVLDP